MKWSSDKQSGNVEDRRGGGGGRVAVGGIGGVIVIVVLSLIMGKNPLELLQEVNSSSVSTEQTEGAPSQASDERAQFVSFVLLNTEEVWTTLFKEDGKAYVDPKLVLFTSRTTSGCGLASEASGPFYCPSDSKVYIDLSFYDELSQRFGAPGDFAMAYVIAHEVGHHVQHLLGITDKVDAMRGQLSEKEMNALSVKLELQADFLAGVWANHAQQMDNILEEGDIEEALNAANAIGDDRLQKESQGYVVPDAFTHGTSKQRMYWFKKGFDSGDINDGDTFSGNL